MKLTVKQTKALDYLEDNTTSEVYYGGAAGGGKSFFGSYWLLKSGFKYPGTRWLMGRSELKNLKKTTLQSFFEVCKGQSLVAGDHYRFNQQDGIISLANGSQIILADLFAYPSDPEFDSLGSLEITGAFVDEAPQISEKAKNIVKSRIRYKLDDYGLIPKLLMCGNPSKNWAYRDYYLPSKDGTIRKYRKFIQALVTDNPYISPHYIESLKGLDKNSRARLLDGDWEYDDDPTTLIDYESILRCFDNRYLDGGEWCITGDIARFGKDHTLIGLWNGFRVRVFRYKGLKTTESTEKIFELQTLYQIPPNRVVVDDDGVGGGVVDQLGCIGFVNNSRPIGVENFANLKSQCYFKLADKINKSGIYIENADVNTKQFIIEELEQVKQYNMDKDGKMQVLPKDKVKEVLGRSPDFADMLMMRMYLELSPKITWGIV